MRRNKFCITVLSIILGLLLSGCQSNGQETFDEEWIATLEKKDDWCPYVVVTDSCEICIDEVDYIRLQYYYAEGEDIPLEKNIQWYWFFPYYGCNIGELQTDEEQ